MRNTSLNFANGRWSGCFKAMSCPCEVIMSACDKTQASKGLEIVSNEAWRIENKFSRFNSNSTIGKINTSNGKRICVDQETARLLDCANTLYELSDGLFDISAGILGSIWRFDGSHQLPSQNEIDRLLPLVGWDKVKWQAPNFTLKAGMSIDLGGIGKEYAADRCNQLLTQIGINRALVNLGGDIVASAAPQDGQHWRVGIEQVGGKSSGEVLLLDTGGIATSGDQRRFIKHKGQRYSHILNPTTGWPVAGAPKSVTTLAANATEAGMYSTLAMLSGDQAEQFLENHVVRYWIQR